MLLTLLLIVVAVVGIFFGLAASRPADFRIERSAHIQAPPSVVFDEVNDFHRWDDWSPWAKIDPSMSQTFEGSPAGAGAVYTWSGNHKAGQGRMEILESRPAEFVKIQIQFIKPFPAMNTGEFAFRPSEEGTEVVWSMVGKNALMAKAFGMVINMDKLVGNDFEKGLAQLKSVSEAKGRAS